MAFKDSTDEKFQDQINGSKLNLIQFSASLQQQDGSAEGAGGWCQGSRHQPRRPGDPLHPDEHRQ